jgi:hypothetical protein
MAQRKKPRGRTVRLDPTQRELLERQRDAFQAKFGRAPGAGVIIISGLITYLRPGATTAAKRADGPDAARGAGCAAAAPIHRLSLP